MPLGACARCHRLDKQRDTHKAIRRAVTRFDTPSLHDPRVYVSNAPATNQRCLGSLIGRLPASESGRPKGLSACPFQSNDRMGIGDMPDWWYVSQLALKPTNLVHRSGGSMLYFAWHVDRARSHLQTPKSVASRGPDAILPLSSSISLYLSRPHQGPQIAIVYPSTRCPPYLMR